MQGRVDDSDPYGRIQEGVAEEVQFSVCSPITSEGKKMGSGKVGPLSRNIFHWTEDQIVFNWAKFLMGPKAPQC